MALPRAMLTRHAENSDYTLCPKFTKPADQTTMLTESYGNFGLARAKRLGNPPDANPSTEVWRLIESLRTPPEAPAA